jgi:hypothetical protein
LAGLYGDNPLMRDRLVLKGGNAFRKGYFVNTRFLATSTSLARPGCTPARCSMH